MYGGFNHQWVRRRSRTRIDAGVCASSSGTLDVPKLGVIYPWGHVSFPGIGLMSHAEKQLSWKVREHVSRTVDPSGDISRIFDGNVTEGRHYVGFSTQSDRLLFGMIFVKKLVREVL